MDDNLKDLKRKWEMEIQRESRKGGSRGGMLVTTDSGVEIPPLSEPSGGSPASLGYPGFYPFTRGVYPSMYRSRLWTMRQYAGFGTAEESNRRYRYLIEHGTTGLSVAFDLPTQMGYDSDDPMAEGEVGKVGVAVDSLADMETLFEGIDLGRVTTSMTINATAAILLCFYVAVARKQGVDLLRLSGTVQNDILKEYAARGTYIYPPAQSIRLVTDVFEWCAENLPRWNTISISGYHMREAGANAVQELAFTFANAIAYVQSAVERDLKVDSFARQISFFLNAHNNFLEEVAKFRAARRIWAHLMKDRFRATDAEAMKFRFHAQTGGSTLTAQQIDNNVVRVTVQALAAVLGGCQSLHTNSKDEALALPSELSARLALRTQQILAYETGVADTIDPLGGSYFVEELTDRIEEKVWEYLKEIDRMGGAVKAIEHGYFQKEIAKSAYEYQRAIEAKGKIIVGVNEYQTPEQQTADVLTIDEGVRTRQIDRLKLMKQKRNSNEVRRCLERITTISQSQDNLIPALLDAVDAYATVGEISKALRSSWGEYRS